MNVLVPQDFGFDVVQIQLPVRPRYGQQFGAAGKKLGSATFIRLAVGVFVANHRVKRTAEVRQGERVGGSAVEDQEHLAISLENLADLSNEAPSPFIVTVRNFGLGICFRESGPGGWTDGRGVVARKFEAFVRRRHRAFPLRDFELWSNRGPPAHVLHRKSPGEKCRLSPRSARLILYPTPPNLYVQPRSRKNKNRIGIGTPRSHSRIYPDAASCSIRSFNLIPLLTLPSVNNNFVGDSQIECLRGQIFLA